MGGVNCIQTFFGFLDFFYIYKVPKHGKDVLVIIIILKLTNQFAWLQCTINCLS